jgi:arylsulfatase
MGAITEMATSAPGNSSIRPKEKAPIAETLRLNGYATGQFGKCHEVPVWEVSPAGPFHQWPTGSGFEYFYVFVGGEANQYYPGLFEGTTAIEPPKSPEEGYTLTEDLANRAITWVRQQKALTPDKPFFMYFAPGATHAPTRCRMCGRTSTRASSMTAGMRCETRHSSSRRSWASFQEMPN